MFLHLFFTIPIFWIYICTSGNESLLDPLYNIIVTISLYPAYTLIAYFITLLLLLSYYCKMRQKENNQKHTGKAMVSRIYHDQSHFAAHTRCMWCNMLNTYTYYRIRLWQSFKKYYTLLRIYYSFIVCFITLSTHLINYWVRRNSSW